MASKHPLRRSCAFCRARKIKCSNETICEACRKQGADCIYDFEPPRLKGRNLSIDSTKSNLLHVRSDHELPDSKRRRSCSASSAPSSPPDRAPDDSGPLAETSCSIAMSLEERFLERFPQDHGHSRISQQKKPETKPRPQDTRYTGPLSLVVYDLIGLVVDRFGSLGCSHNEGNSGYCFRSGLASDNAPVMFDSISPAGNPLSGYGQRQRNQLIDVWYSVHPLSFLISKTLLLREVRDGTCDEILLAVMLAEATFVLGNAATIRGHELLQWAKSQLEIRPRHQHSSEDSIHSGIPTRVYKGITTAQSLVLLAWNALSSHEFRRAACYIDLASRMATEIRERMLSEASPPNSSRINGVDVLGVETEIATYLWWTTFSLNLWMYIQTEGCLPEPTTTAFSLDSLPETEALSVLIELDLVSENFSTIQKQKSSMREVWPLAHISSTVACLFSHTPGQAAGYGFRDLQETIQQGHSDKAQRHLLLAFHHIMAIQFLFPKNASCRDQGGLSADTVGHFCSSLEEVLRFLTSTPEQPCDPLSVIPLFHTPLPNALCILLDTCSRAFDLIRASFNPSLNIPGFHKGWDGRLGPLASRLYIMTKDDRFHQGKTIRAVRKHLKGCARVFGALDTSNSLGRSELGMNRMSSMSHSPQQNVQIPSHLAAASHTVTEAASPFSCIEEISRISSSMPSSSGSSANVSAHSFTPFQEMGEWQMNGGFSQGLLATNPSHSSTIHHGIPEAPEMHNLWYSQAPVTVRFEPADPNSTQFEPWVWPATSADETAFLSFQSLDMEED
ncbi:hypothetical protein FZEAL_9496 [Fusarium zealandicum]|uniref:Zn(2)-C6 fungal-type domain-containing protein n=1 Tax=Fusarium zealandicum TaxID=1053134 RepID=A0A8H4UAP0_9HYPO|nr:hypothetical protein FZEAL_9496 [Fusarium zealandicum]